MINRPLGERPKQDPQAPSAQRSAPEGSRHRVSGGHMTALDLSTRSSIAVPAGVARSHDSLDSLVIAAKAHGESLLVDGNGRQYVKLCKLSEKNQGYNSELFLVQIPDPVANQVFFGKQITHPKREKPDLTIKLPPSPFGNSEVENEVRQALETDSILTPHAVLVTDAFALVLSPLGVADAFNVLQSIYADQATPKYLVRLMLQQVVGELAQKYHARTKAHRDIKLENVLIADAGRFTLGDHGHTQHAEVVDGKVSTHQPPEGQLGVVCDARKLDIWALGVSAMQMLTSDLFFSRATQNRYVPGTASGERLLREDVEAYTHAWMEFGGPLTLADAQALQALFPKAPAPKKTAGQRRLKSASRRDDFMTREGMAEKFDKIAADAPELRHFIQRVIDSPNQMAQARSQLAQAHDQLALAHRQETQAHEQAAEVRNQLAQARNMAAQPRDQVLAQAKDAPALTALTREAVQAAAAAVGYAKQALDSAEKALQTAVEAESTNYEQLRGRLESLDKQDASTYPLLLAMMLPETLDSPLFKRPSVMRDVFMGALETGESLEVVWPRILHALNFTPTCLRAKFEALKEADPEMFPVLVQALHPVSQKRPDAETLSTLLAADNLAVPKREQAKAQMRLARIKGKARSEYEQYAQKYVKPSKPKRSYTEPLPTRARRNTVSSIQTSGHLAPRLRRADTDVFDEVIPLTPKTSL